MFDRGLIRRKAALCIIGAVFGPFGIAMFLANIYIVLWYYQTQH